MLLHKVDQNVSYEPASYRVHLSFDEPIVLTLGETELLAKSLQKAVHAMRTGTELVSKKKARDAGLTRYFTGIRCVNGHVSERMVSNGACLQCLRSSDYRTDEQKKQRAKNDLVRRKSTPEKRLAHNRKERLRQRTNFTRVLRNRMNLAVKTNARAGSAVRDLGCSIPEFRTYLEAKFTSNMSWENYGLWELDHIKPLCLFDLTDRAQFLKAAHYTNYQPLWRRDNQLKGRRYDIG